MNKFIKRIDRNFLLLSAIILTAFWFRIQGFIYETFAFTYDVGRDMLAVSSMLENHKPLLIGATTGLHGIFYGPTWYYLLTPFFLLFQGDPRGIAFIMNLSGVATVIIGYFLGKNLGGYAMGFILAILFALSQVLTEVSAQIWNPNFIPLFVVFLLFFLTSKLNSKKIYYPLVIGLTLGVIFDLEIVFGILFSLSISTYLFIFEKYSRNIKFIALILGGFIAVQIPRVLFEMRHDFLMTQALVNSIFSKSDSPLLTLTPQVQRTFLVLFKVWSDTIAWQSSIVGIIVAIFCISIIALSYKKLKALEKKIVKLLIIVPAFYLIGLSFFNHDIESHYYIGLPAFYILIVSYSVYLFFAYINKSIVILLALILILSILVNQIKILGTFKKSTWIGDASVYRNQVEVINYIYTDAKGEEFNYVAYTPPIFDYPYQYLFKWKGKRDYGYVPSKDNQELFYLIIEPDLQFPVRQAEWLRVRQDDGQVIAEKEFPSGIRVQKRIH